MESKRQTVVLGDPGLVQSELNPIGEFELVSIDLVDQLEPIEIARGPLALVRFDVLVILVIAAAQLGQGAFARETLKALSETRFDRVEVHTKRVLVRDQIVQANHHVP